MLSQDIVELSYKKLHRGDKLDETFRHEDRTEVPTLVGTLHDHIAKLTYDLVERHVLCLHFLRDEAEVGLALKGAFEGDMACRAAHELDEVIVFLR